MEIHWRSETENHMKIHETNGVTYLTFQAFEELPGIVHGFSTRLGGVSRGDCTSMNLSFSRGDREEDVRENYRSLPPR